MTTHDDDAHPQRRYGGHGRFEDRLAGAEPAECAVARWFEAHGRRVTVLAQTQPGQRGAPLLPGLDGSVAAPDLLVAHPRSHKATMVEVKSKSSASWYRFTGCWTSGISAEELRRYQEAEARTGLRCWLAFIQRGKGDRWVANAPSPPSGLYLAPVAGLKVHANHTFGRDGWRMVYWRLDSAPWCHLASLEDLGLVA